jgi:hypothetical protein
MVVWNCLGNKKIAVIDSIEVSIQLKLPSKTVEKFLLVKSGRNFAFS